MIRAYWRRLALLVLPAATVVFAVVACSSEEAGGPGQVASPSLDGEVSTIVPIQIQPLPRVDLIVLSYTTNIAPTTTSCGGTLPNVSCAGGQRNFTATATIRNIGQSALAPGQISVAWTDLNNGSTQIQTVPHPGIPVGGTFQINRPYYMGPCDCVPPFTWFTHSFNATVDPNNAIPETNENNNVSRTYVTCDGC